jgi:DNA-binding MarR family transcriptional regulator
MASRYSRPRSCHVSGEVMSRNSRATNPGQSEAEEDPRLFFEELDGLLGYWMRRAQGAMHRDYMAAVAGLDLTQKQTATLWLIHGNPGVSQVSVAAALGMDRATMMALVDRLEERGFVLRKKSKADRRRQELYATPAGQSMLRKIRTRIEKHEARFKALFTPDELTALLSALKRFQGIA